MKKSIVAFCLTFALSACASSKPEPIELQPLADASICCNSFASFPWYQLTSNEEFDFNIDDSAPIAKFAEGNSYFNAFMLPSNAKSVQLTITSKMVNGRVFAPKVISLDENFAVVDAKDINYFGIKTADAFRRNQYELNLMLDTERTPYLVIYSPADSIGTQVEVEHPARTRAKAYGEPMPMVTDPKYLYTHTGSLSLSVATHSLKGYQQGAAKKPQAVIENAATANLARQNQQYYFSAIEQAVQADDISKALTLLEAAKALKVAGVEDHFVKLVKTR